IVHLGRTQKAVLAVQTAVRLCEGLRRALTADSRSADAFLKYGVRYGSKITHRLLRIEFTLSLLERCRYLLPGPDSGPARARAPDHVLRAGSVRAPETLRYASASLCLQRYLSGRRGRRAGGVGERAWG